MANYATVEEANAYIETHYLSTDETRIAWETLPDADKEVLLTVSSDAIDSLVIPGVRAFPGQEREFPRCPHINIPKDIIAATIENSLTLSKEVGSQDVATYQRMWSYGISSYTIGNLSESIGTAGGNAQANATTWVQSGISSLKAQALLTKYIGGSYRIE